MVGSEVAAELFRRCDSRGFHARLLSPIEAYFHEQGVDDADHLVSNDLLPPPTQVPAVDIAAEGPAASPLFVPERTCGTVSSKDPRLLERARQLQASSSAPLGPPLQRRFDFIELFAGCARMTKAFADRGLVVGPSH